MCGVVKIMARDFIKYLKQAKHRSKTRIKIMVKQVTTIIASSRKAL
jgi:hypothetical protein